MKLLLVMAPSECLEEIQKIVGDHQIHAYTELPNLPGAGASGGRLGTRAYPGTSSILLTIVDSDEAERLRRTISTYAAKPENCNLVRIFAVSAEQLL